MTGARTANDMTLSEAETCLGQITPEMIRFLKKFEVSRLHISDLFVSAFCPITIER